MSEKKKPNAFSGLVSLVIVIGLGVYFYGGGFDNEVAIEMSKN